MHPVPSSAKITWGRVAIVVTVLSWMGYVLSTILRQFLDYGGGFRFTMEALSYLVVVSFLTFSALMYLVARQGALVRFRDHVRAPRGVIDRHFGNRPSERLTVLVPSYAEEPDVVRLTLWSAALQEYPDLHLVLLIDDPPNPTDPAVAAKLEATRRLVADITNVLQKPRKRFESALRRAESQLGPGKGSAQDVKKLQTEYEAASAWLDEMAAAELVVDHVSEFFVDQVLIGLANELNLTALALNASIEQGDRPDAARLIELYRRLVWIFRADLQNFERKTYGSLSHEANKAMNVNAYLGLMGHVWRPTVTAAGVMLDEVDTAEDGDIDIPDSGYVLTLDADSQLLRDYCIRLVYYLEQSENQQVAIIQTPYSSFRGAPTRIERIAGASTDLQHILHQGKTLPQRDVLGRRERRHPQGGARGHRRGRERRRVRHQDLHPGPHGHRGHRVQHRHRHRRLVAGQLPERLSYSATPPDFGSLVVQRRRWANGGLLILPKLWQQVRHRQRNRERVHLTELALRVNYMASIAWASFGLLFLLFYPYDSRLLSPLVLGAAVPYFVAMGSDLRECGHRFSDIFRIYGFNLVLLPVNLAGVLKSIQQAFTGEKIPFARTPKVRNRTAAPALHVLVPYLIVIFSVFTAWRDFHQQNWGNCAFAVFNAVLASMAIWAYIGLRASIVDMALGVVNWLYVEPKPKVEPKLVYARPDDHTIDWASILYYGDRRLARDLRRRGDRRRRIRRGGAAS